MSFDEELRTLERCWEEEKENIELGHRLLRAYMKSNRPMDSKKILPFLLKDRLKQSKDWSEIKTIIDIDPRRTFVVGGRVYRNLLEIIHGDDFNSDGVDWDLYYMGDTTENAYREDLEDFFNTKKPGVVLPKNGICALGDRLQEAEAYSPHSVKVTSKKDERLSVDIISSLDVYRLRGKNDYPNVTVRLKKSQFRSAIEDYLKEVPLTIQAVIFDIKNCKLYGGKAARSIYTKKVDINNDNGCCFKEYFNTKKLNVKFIQEERTEESYPNFTSGLRFAGQSN